MAAPHRDRDAPTVVTHRTRGRRTFRMIFFAMLSGTGSFQTVFQMVVSVSETEILTLPMQMHRIMVRNRANVRRR